MFNKMTEHQNISNDKKNSTVIGTLASENTTTLSGNPKFIFDEAMSISRDLAETPNSDFVYAIKESLKTLPCREALDAFYYLVELRHMNEKLVSINDLQQERKEAQDA